jgi:hypothetical protein
MLCLPMPRLASTLAAVILALTALNLACATGAEKLVRRSVPAAINESLKALNDPENQELMRRLVDLPEIQKAAHDLTEAITGGALDGLTDDARAAKLRELTDKFVNQVATSVSRDLDAHISPSLTRAVEDIVGGAVGAALSPENRQQARSFVEAITRTTVATFGQSTGKALRDDLGPAAQHVIENNLGPALEHLIEKNLVPSLKRALDDEAIPAAGRLTREVSRQAVLGAHDALVELQVDKKLGGLDADFWVRLDKLLNQGQKAGETAIWIFVLVIIALGIWLARSIIVRKHLEQERASSERMLLNVLQAIQRGDTDDPSKPPDLDSAIARAHAQDPGLASNNYLAGLVAKARAAVLAGITKDPPKT